MYALDTNIISYILHGNKNVKERWREEESAGRQATIPLVVYYEIRRGLLAKGAIVKMQAFESLCAMLRVSDLTKADMDIAASIYAKLKSRGLPIDDTDLLIAAQCLTNNHVLVTNNTRHFERIEGLQIINWAD